MKIKYLLISLLLATGLTTVWAGGADDSNEKIIVGTEGTYKPYTYHDESGKLTGYDVEVMEAIAKHLNREIEFVESRWDSLLAGLKVNRWDVVANQVWRNESREEEYLLSQSYLMAGASILVKNDNPAESLTDLQGKKAAVSLTSSFRPIVENVTEDIEFQDDFILAVDLLTSGRVEFIVNDTQTIGQYLAENPDNRLKAFVLTEAPATEVVLALNKDNQVLLEDINKALMTLKKQGVLDKLNKKYFAGIK